MADMVSLFKGFLPRSLRDKYRRPLLNAWHTAPKLFQWHASRLSGRISYPRNPDGRVLVHLGCGDIADARCINVDKRPAPHVHHLSGVETLPFFGDSLADLVYVSHCLEHVPYDRVPQVLREWRRVLKPGGKLRLAVPDFDGIVTAYQLSGNNASLVQPTLMGGQNYPLNFHFAIFNKQQLTRLLEEAGFDHVREWHHGEDDLATFNDCSTACIPVGEKQISVSLNMEALKTA